MNLRCFALLFVDAAFALPLKPQENLRSARGNGHYHTSLIKDQGIKAGLGRPSPIDLPRENKIGDAYHFFGLVGAFTLSPRFSVGGSDGAATE